MPSTAAKTACQDKMAHFTRGKLVDPGKNGQLAHVPPYRPLAGGDDLLDLAKQRLDFRLGLALTALVISEAEAFEMQQL